MAVIIDGYQLTTGWSTSGNCQWAYAQKNGKGWFIKEFMKPKLKRVEDGFSPRAVENARARCEAFQSSQNLLYTKIRESNTGNIVAPTDFFCFGTKFYAVSPQIEILSTLIEDVAKINHEGKINLLKVLTYNLKRLHENGVVHADLKPDNILLKKTSIGFTFKLIDFDASFLESEPKRGEDICFDLGFMAPETAIARFDETISLTHKIDIFAMGLLFHLYYTGKMPKIPEEFDNVCSAVLEGAPPELDKKLPLWLSTLIQAMISLNPAERPDCEAIFQALTQQDYGVPKQPAKPVPTKPTPVETPKKKKGWETPYSPQKA